MPARPFYVTTPIYYVNDVPHLGSAYTTIAADALRRFNLLLGRESRMLTGTDEHGEKAELAAQAQNKDPVVYVEGMSARFKEAWPKLEIETDDFIRTHEERHTRLVAEMWKKIEATGDLYLGTYEGWYCVGCEGFKTEKELVEPGHECPLHPGKPVEWLKEPTYYFKLSKYEKPLLDFYARHPEFIEPESRRNEVLSFVKSGLKDLSVSRTSFTWGIPVPGNEKHIMYVWFDALANYWTALASGELDAKFWSPNAEVVHLVGKDILRFHTVYWPAFLLAAGYGEEKLPTRVYAHGFLTVDGMKMSKSLRNTVSPLRLAEELAPYGGADVLRYTLLRAIAFGQDGDFDHAGMLVQYNADLAKNVGNLLSRTIGLCVKNWQGKTPVITAPLLDIDTALHARCAEAFRASRAAWADISPTRALEASWDVASAANQYVDHAAPWTAAKNGDDARVATILGTLLGILETLSVMMWPVLPTKAQEMRAQLALPPLLPHVGLDQWPTAIPVSRESRQLAVATPLFPTIDPDARAALLARVAPKTEEIKTPVAQPVQSSAPPPASATIVMIPYDDFARVDLRVGEIKTCERVKGKDKLLQMTVDVGEPDLRPIVAGLALTFTPEQLVGKRVVVVANLAPRDFGKGLVSHGMILATGPSEALVLATVDGGAAPGARLK